MTKAVLKFISDAMASENIPYEFMEYTSSIDSISSYWVGEFSETESITEDGLQESQFILTGTGKGAWLDLMNQKEKIEELFPAIGGKKAILDNHSGVAVFYGNSFPVPTGDGFLKRLQINLIIKEWKVN